MRSLALAAGAALLATPPLAATVTTSRTAPDLGGFVQAPLDASQFTTLGRCGSGGALVGDGCQPVNVSEAGGPIGRYDQDETLPGVNSQDAAVLAWDADLGGSPTLTFALIDANDQASSHLYLTLGGESVNLSQGERWGSGNLLWVTVSLAGWEEGIKGDFESVELVFSTKETGNDGISFAQAHVEAETPAAVPLPASAILLLAALGSLGALTHRHR